MLDAVCNVLSLYEPVEIFGNVSMPFLPRCMECRRGPAIRILSVRPSVCLSVCQTRNLWQNGIKIGHDFLYHTKDHLATFSQKKNGWWGATPSTWNVWLTGSRWSEIADFELIFVRSSSAVTPIEKSLINTDRKCTTRFPMSLRWSSYVARNPPKGVGGLKNPKRMIFV